MSDLTSEAEGATPAMCLAWRLFRDHGKAAADLVDAERMRCLKAGDSEAAAEWIRVAEALVEWCS